MIVALGSTNIIKREAVRIACATAGLDVTILGFAAASGVNAQPVGHEETLAGARNRAFAARAVCPKAEIAIGIENGLCIDGEGWVDIAVVVLLTSDGKQAILLSPSVPFPIAFVEEARARGFATTTVGAVMAERVGSDPHDPHPFLTGGMKTRKDLLIETLVKGVRT